MTGVASTSTTTASGGAGVTRFAVVLRAQALLSVSASAICKTRPARVTTIQPPLLLLVPSSVGHERAVLRTNPAHGPAACPFCTLEVLRQALCSTCGELCCGAAAACALRPAAIICAPHFSPRVSIHADATSQNQRLQLPLTLCHIQSLHLHRSRLLLSCASVGAAQPAAHPHMSMLHVTAGLCLVWVRRGCSWYV